MKVPEDLADLLSEYEDLAVDMNELCPTMPRASTASIAYAKDLLEKCDLLDDYNWDEMSQKEVSELIDELKEEVKYSR